MPLLLSLVVRILACHVSGPSSILGGGVEFFLPIHALGLIIAHRMASKSYLSTHAHARYSHHTLSHATPAVRSWRPARPAHAHRANGALLTRIVRRVRPCHASPSLSTCQSTHTRAHTRTHRHTLAHARVYAARKSSFLSVRARGGRARIALGDAGADAAAQWRRPFEERPMRIVQLAHRQPAVMIKMMQVLERGLPRERRVALALQYWERFMSALPGEDTFRRFDGMLAGCAEAGTELVSCCRRPSQSWPPAGRSLDPSETGQPSMPPATRRQVRPPALPQRPCWAPHGPGERTAAAQYAARRPSCPAMTPDRHSAPWGRAPAPAPPW